jgi:hypothetical protein
MKKAIYNAFTIENGIILTNPVISYISTKVNSLEDISSLLANFKLKFNSSQISIEQVDSLLCLNKIENKNFFSLKTYEKFQVRDLIKEFESSKKRSFFNSAYIKNVKENEQTHNNEDVNVQENKLAKGISLLEGGEEIIFGIFYRNRKGTFSLEDDYDVIELDLNGIENDSFLYDGMFVGLSGTLRPVINNVNENVFAVKKVLLLDSTTSFKQNNFLENKKIKICIFNSFDINFIFSILMKYTPELTIIFSENSLKLEKLKDFKIILIKRSFIEDELDECIFREKNNREILKGIIENSVENGVENGTRGSLISRELERSMEKLAERSVEKSKFIKNDSFSISLHENPLVVELFDVSIACISTDLFKNRQNGLFFNKNPLESFLKSIISQNSLFPFGNLNFSVEEFPNFLIILQDFHPVVLDVNNFEKKGVKVMSLPKEGYFGLLDFKEDIYEIRQE